MLVRPVAFVFAQAVDVAAVLLGRTAGAGFGGRRGRGGSASRGTGAGRGLRRGRRLRWRGPRRSPASRMRQTSRRCGSVMVSTSPGPTLWSVRSVRSELTRMAPVSISFCARVRDFTAREKNSHLSRRCFSKRSYSDLGFRSAASAAQGEFGSSGAGLRSSRGRCSPSSPRAGLSKRLPAGFPPRFSNGLPPSRRLALGTGRALALAGLVAATLAVGATEVALRALAIGFGRLSRLAVLLRGAAAAGCGSGGADCRDDGRPGNQISSNSGSAGAAASVAAVSAGGGGFGSRLGNGRLSAGSGSAKVGGRRLDFRCFVGRSGWAPETAVSAATSAAASTASAGASAASASAGASAAGGLNGRGRDLRACDGRGSRAN